MIDSRKKALDHFRKEKRSSRDTMEIPSEMKKVSVMSDSEEGLEEGLEKAQELMESGAIPAMEEAAEESSHEAKDYSDEALASMSREELIDCIKKMKEE